MTKDSRDDHEGCEENTPRLLPHALALVVPAMAEVHERVEAACQESEGVRHADGERVLYQNRKYDPVVASGAGCGGKKGKKGEGREGEV